MALDDREVEVAGHYWSRITIGGTISTVTFKRLCSALKEDIVRDITPEDYSGLYLDISMDNMRYGEYNHAEKFCESNKIPYERDHETDNGLFRRVFDGKDCYEYSLDGDHEVVVIASDLFEIYEALKEVSKENAPLHVNSENEVTQEYAKVLLSNENPLEFIKSKLEEALPEKPPYLPPFKIVEED